MSSSDNFPDWSVFKERKLPETLNIDILSPSMEMSVLLQRYSGDAKKARQDIDAAHYEGINIAAQQAVYIVQLAAALENYEPALKDASLQRVHRHLRIIKDQMLSALAREGLDIIIPANKPFDEVADLVHVEGWRHSDKFTSEVVAEVLEPIIYYKGNMIRMGRVVMGAPPDNAIEQTTIVNTEKRLDNG
jgi:hypothetical protein